MPSASQPFTHWKLVCLAPFVAFFLHQRPDLDDNVQSATGAHLDGHFERRLSRHTLSSGIIALEEGGEGRAVHLIVVEEAVIGDWNAGLKRLAVEQLVCIRQPRVGQEEKQGKETLDVV